jgi:hypothetical protein
MGGTCSIYGEHVKSIQGERPLGKPERIWENTIRIDLRKTRREVADSGHLVNTVIKARNVFTGLSLQSAQGRNLYYWFSI